MPGVATKVACALFCLVVCASGATSFSRNNLGKGAEPPSDEKFHQKIQRVAKDHLGRLYTKGKEALDGLKAKAASKIKEKVVSMVQKRLKSTMEDFAKRMNDKWKMKDPKSYRKWQKIMTQRGMDGMQSSFSEKWKSIIKPMWKDQWEGIKKEGKEKWDKLSWKKSDKE